MNVYSTRFLAFFNPGSGGASYAVPTGFVAVVKHVDIVSNASGTTATLTVDTIPIWAPQFQLPSGASEVSALWDGMAVANPGEVIGVVASGFVAGQVSGYLLTAP